jgi:uncharacterized protein YndB with AHSA1/START domain
VTAADTTAPATPAAGPQRMTLTLPSDHEIVLTRTFDAPRRLVFKAWTEPQHVRHWYGCTTHALTVCEIDLSVGGAWRYTMRAPDGSLHTMQGRYREIAPPDRLVYTEQYVTAGFASGEALVTVSFAESGGRTTLTSTILHASRADRDAHLASGMESGAAQVYDRLADHLATMA